jgi:hypothetical protein
MQPGNFILLLTVLLWSCHQREKPLTYADTTAITIPGVDSIDSVEIYNLANPVYNSGKWIKHFASLDTFPVYSSNMLLGRSSDYNTKIFIIFTEKFDLDSTDYFFSKYFEMDSSKYFIQEKTDDQHKFAAQLAINNRGYHYMAYKTFPYKNFNVLLLLWVLEEFNNYPRDTTLARHAYFKDVEVRLK